MTEEKIKEAAAEEKERMTLEFDDGEEVEYDVEGVIEVNGQDYIVLVQTENDDMLEVFRLESVSDEEEEIVAIEDDDEYDAVLAELRECGYDIRIDEE
ncbi:MAG: DUF1292 domain-containing protein [Eubacteriales bacterium]|jgi:transcriptional antiterminator Rof (Rho-off)|nr:DUF1292 domain-containing protein [Eubacteriales bacterium]